MKKKLLSILLTFCMVLTLLPTAAFAEGNTEEELPACTCETACTAESMNADCPVCGAGGAVAEDCGKYTAPVINESQPAQSEGELMALNGEDETVIQLMQSNISNYMSSGLTDGSYKLGENVTVKTGSLEVKGTVTLDLNGHTLLFKDPELYYPPEQGQVNAGIRVYNSDSSESAAKYALTLCDTSTAKTGTLDVWGESMAESGEGLFVGQNGELTMTGGTITDSSETNPWGIGIGIIEGKVTMTGGKIENQTRCGVTLAGGTFEMSGDAVISNCGSSNFGGGIWIGGGMLTMSGGTITGCNATQGGGVYVGVGTFNMSGGSIENCKASADGSSAFGGGIYNAGRTTLSGTAKIRNCQAANAGGGIYDYRVLNISDNVEITGCTAPLWSAMIVSGTISGGTFNGTVTSGDTITGGTFNGEVRNVGTITGGTFNGQVTNPGRITGGTFKGGITGIPALATGSGTETDPYQIGTAIGLEWFQDKVNSGEYGACAVLTADIDLNNENWTPIGIISNNSSGQGAYTGTFDGKGHTISGLNVSGELVYAGLFGAVKGGTIKNLTVAGNVSPSNSQCIAGGIVGYASNAAIENCSNHSSVSGGNASIIGGIAGCNFDGAKIIDCYNVGTISGINYAKASGGIVGSNSGTISNCYNVGKVSGGDHVGEIAGDNFGTVENCYYLNATNNNAVGKNTGTITSTKSMTAAEFADGTVLKLLKADRDDSPWDSVSKVWNGMVLPGFTWQNNNHTHGDKLRHVEAKAATTREEGNIEYWHCEACGKYFSDNAATKEITQAETVIPKRQSSGSNYSYYTIKATAGTGGAISPSGNVSVRGGRDQTFTITPDQGYAVSDVQIDGESVGAVTSYTFENVRKAHTIAVSFAKVKAFVDVPAGSYYEDAVNWAVENGITQGTDDTHFSPDDVCTRAQMVTFLWRAAGSPKVEDGKNPFVDVKADAYYYDAVLWAVEKGVTSGTSATTFSPDATVTRGQTVTFLYRNAGSPEVSGTMPFTDVEADAYYAKAVQWAVQQKITTGTSETTFSPMSDCTRGQIVTFLYRAK